MEPRDPGARLILDGEAVERDRIGSARSTRVWDIISVLCDEALESREGRPSSRSQRLSLGEAGERTMPRVGPGAIASSTHLPTPGGIFKIVIYNIRINNNHQSWAIKGSVAECFDSILSIHARYAVSSRSTGDNAVRNIAKTRIDRRTSGNSRLRRYVI